MTQRHQERRPPRRSGARRHGGERLRLAQIEALNEVTNLTVSALDPAIAARRALDYVVERFDIAAAAAWELGDSTMELIASVNFPRAYVETTQSLPLDASLDNVKVAVTGEPIAAENLSEHNPAARVRFAATGVSVGAYAIVPILAKGRVIGVLGFTWTEPRPIPKSDLDFYTSFAAQLGLALENARLFEAERLRAARMEVLRDIGGLVASSLDVRQVVDAALSSAEEHIGVMAASVWLVDAVDWLHLVGARGFRAQIFEEFAEGLPLDAAFDVARVVRTGKPVVRQDVAQSGLDVAVTQIYERHEMHLGAHVALPLRAGSEVAGALTLAWETPREFDDDAIAFDESFANTLSAALANARLFEDVRRQGERITEIINSMSDAFVSVDREWRYVLVNPTAAAMLGRSAEYLIGRRMDEEFPDVAGWPYYRKAMAQRVAVSFESYAEMAGVWVEVHAFPSLEGISMYVSDITERKTAQRELDRARQRLDAHIGNSPLAVVEFDREFRIIRWSEGAERIFGWTADEVLGKAIGEFRWVPEEDAALVAQESEGLFSGATPRSCNTNRNYRKDGDVIWCEWYSSAIYDDRGLVSVFSQVLDITGKRQAEEDLVNALAEVADERTRLREIINEIPVGVGVIGPDGAVLEVNEAANRIWAGTLPKAADTDGYSVYEGYDHGTDRPVQPSEWPGPRAIESGRPENGLIDFTRLDHTTGVVRISALPIYDDSDEITRVVVISEDVTEQIDAQRLAASLNEIVLEVSSTLEEREILDRLMRKGHETLGTQAAATVVRRDRRWVVESGIGLPEELLGRVLRDSDGDAMQAIFKQTEPVVASDAQQDPRVMGGKLAELEAKSVIALPLISRGECSGALFFWHADHRLDFSLAQVEFGRKLMTIASMALDNAHLFEREHRIAETLQQAILTPPEPIAGLEISYIYQAASQAARVGGDFYDVISVEADKVGFIVGDVSGKGIEAARFTSLMKDGARAFLLDGDSPARVLERLNTLAWRSTPIEKFATAFVGVLNTSTGSLTYAASGHPSGLVLSATGSRALESSTGLLGAWQSIDAKDSECLLDAGEILVVYTDGATDVRRDGVLLGEEGLRAKAEQLAASSAKELPQTLLDAVLDYADGGLRDDIVILCLARDAKPTA